MSGLRRLPQLLFVAATLLVVFFAGMYVEERGLLPSTLIRSAYKTAIVGLRLHKRTEPADIDSASAHWAHHRAEECLERGSILRRKLRHDIGMYALRCASGHIASADAAAARVDFLAGDALAEPVLVKGEIGAFLEHCPWPGCLAVEYDRSGTVSRVWPWSDAIAERNIVPDSDFPYEHAAGWSFLRDISDFQISPHPSGDLLVVFHFGSTHPHGGGVARIAPDGHPRWYRKDYSHHWPHVIDDDLALVPGMRLRRARISLKVHAQHPRGTMKLECGEHLIMEDSVNILGGSGELLEEISVLDAIIASPYRGLLSRADGCNPTHLNFAHMLGADAGGADGIAPGDLVVSLRNLHAFGILDKDDRRLKRLVRGGFHQQHGVRHLDKARFMMFDNYGTDGVHGPSRLLVVDLATGEETTVFPTDNTPEHLRYFFTDKRGQFDISADRRRVLLTDEPWGRAFEIRLADGEVLNVFRQVHDLSNLTRFVDNANVRERANVEMLTKHAWLFRMGGIHYGEVRR